MADMLKHGRVTKNTELVTCLLIPLLPRGREYPSHANHAGSLIGQCDHRYSHQVVETVSPDALCQLRESCEEHSEL